MVARWISLDDGVPGRVTPESGAEPGRDETEASELRQRAIALLARREHAQAELVRKLCARGRAEPEHARAVVDALAEEGLQSDARCAEMIVYSRVQRGQGPLKIRAALRQAGIAGEMADRVLEAEEDHWPERLEDVVARRFGATAAGDAREWGRRARFLASRGFPESLIRDVLGAVPR